MLSKSYTRETSRKDRHRWEDNIRLDPKVLGVNRRNWTNLAQDMDYWSPCECRIEPLGSINHGVS